MLAALFATLALAGAPAEPVCHGQLAPPTKAETERLVIAGYMERRAEFGFRSDEAYVRELIRRGVWEYDVGYIPVTPAENRYLRLRDRLDLGAAARRYLRRRPAVYGGISVQDDWPRGPYLRVYLTRRRAMHTTRLRRLVRFPGNLRTVRVAHSERALRRLQRRIGRDLRALERAGFDLASWGVDVYTNSVQVDLVTRRTDHAAFFRQRYGPVTTRVMATERTALECARADHFRHTDGGLEIHWGSGGSRVVERFEVVEHDDQVEVGVVERVSTTFDTSDYRPAHDRVALRAPLGDRVVVDAATGLRLRQQGPSPGEPACPAARQPSRLDEFIATRRSLGLPAGRAYARRMLRREDPFTKREWRYRSLREALEYDGRIEAYLRSHRDVDGGSSIVDRFPRRPLLVVRITARRALHEARLKQLARHPGLLRTIPATHTVDQLESIAARIRDDAGTRSGFVDAYGDAGFLVTWLNVSGGRVVVQLVTTRADAAVYFRERYGPVVRTRVLGDRHECA